MRALLGRWGGRLLAVPLTGKLVTASVAVAGLVAAAAVAAVDRFAGVGALPPELLVGGAFAAGAFLLAALNGALIRLALRPIRELERSAGRVEAGDLSARAAPTPFADRRLRRVTELFNSALDGVTELRSRLRAVARRAVSKREEERRELAARLQEDVAQQLAACLLKLKLARGPVEGGQREELLDQLRDEAAEVLESVRRLARELRPPELADIGVGGAVEAFARSLSESTGIRVDVDREPVDGHLDEEGRLALYRVVQDLLVDAAHRSDGAAVRLRLGPEGRNVVLELEERAGPPGAPPGPVPGRDRPDLLEIRERVAYVGGRVTATAGADGTYRVHAEIPRRGGAGRRARSA
ncbi:MAG: sensor histidine kinase [Gemmatimonadota bacterium]